MASLNRSPSPPLDRLGDITYRYRPIDKSGSEIRLLRLLPHDANRPGIHCEILHCSPTNPFEYSALSYAWGDPDETRVIYVEGHKFPVTVNLGDALQQLQSHAYPLLLWVDAICIDQTNTDERSHQVQLMTSIYRQASMVAVWLGPEYDGSKSATELLCCLAEIGKGAESGDRLMLLVKDQTLADQWYNLACLFSRDYWKRLWVLQEVLNAREVTTFCGNTALPWQTYLDASILLYNHRTELVRAFHAIEQNRLVYNLAILPSFRTITECLIYEGPRIFWALYKSRRCLPIDHLLLCRLNLCKDPRDKLYGILGVLSEQDQSHFRVDYNKSVRDVYTDMAVYLLLTCGIDVMCLPSGGTTDENVHRLPSWVPDWSQLSVPLFLIHGCDFTAALSRQSVYNISHSRRNLEVAAIVLGRVKRTTMCHNHLNSSELIVFTYLQWYMVFEQSVRSGAMSDSDHEAFCRAICLDRTAKRWNAHEWARLLYGMMISQLRTRYPSLGLPESILKFQGIMDPEALTDAEAEVFQEYFYPDRRMVIMEGGIPCSASNQAIHGDIICVPLGCRTPVVVRKRGSEYIVIGDCYVDGYMYGRAVEELEKGDLELRKFVLV